MRKTGMICAAWLAVTASLAMAQAPAPKGPERFAPEIAAFAKADQAGMPAPCGFLFVGSSSIRFWKSLATDMAPLPVINRGFGGSTIADVDFYFDKVVAPYRPRAIVFYAGENDLTAGATPEQVAQDFARFMDLKTKAFGATEVYFISAKPSKLRFAELAAQADLNRRVQALAKARHDLAYIDVVPAMLENGAPKDIYVADGLHMTPAGYAIWTAIVKPVLEREAKKPASCKAA
jgi:lysophospholipase L1-like esterase